MSGRRWAFVLARASVSLLFKGPVGAGETLLTQSLGLLEDQAQASGTVESLVRAVEESLGSWAKSEGIDEAELDRAADLATRIIDSGDLGARHLVQVTFDAEVLFEELVAANRTLLASVDQRDEDHCLALLKVAVIRLMRERAQWPAAQFEYRHAMLVGIAQLQEHQAQLAESLRGPRLADLLSPSMIMWDRSVHPASALLRAEYAVVPFYGRTSDLDALREWLNAPERLGLRLYSGAGGMGKTRLLLESVLRAQADGWVAGFVPSAATSEDLKSWSGSWKESWRDTDAGAFLVIDYAETRRDLIVAAVGEALASRVRVRIALLARSAGEWWSLLRARSGQLGDFLNGPATSHLQLDPVVGDERDRDRLYAIARANYQGALGIAGDARPYDPTRIEDDDPDRVLYLLAQALRDVLSNDESESPLGFVLRREGEFLNRAVLDLGEERLQGAPIRQAVAIVTLAGGARTREDAVQIISRAPAMARMSDETLSRVADLLHSQYPSPDGWTAGLQPDLLGEELVTEECRADPDLVGALGEL